MLPLLMTTILTLVPISRRGAVMGNVSIAISVAPAMGPTVSGLILQNFSWRFMFVFVLPIALLAFGIGARFLRNIGENEKTRLDALSVMLTVPAFGGVVYGLSQIGGSGGAATPAVAALVVGVVALLALSCASSGCRSPTSRCWTCAPSTSGCSPCPCCCWWSR